MYLEIVLIKHVSLILLFSLKKLMNKIIDAYASYNYNLSIKKR